MSSKDPLQVDSIMEILSAQCSDLESLLALARRETAAIEKRDFDELLHVVTQRASLGDRLEVYHRQLADLRSQLGELPAAIREHSVSTQTVALVAAIQTQDAYTRPLLAAARDESLKLSLRTDQARRNLTAYSCNNSNQSIACDKRI